MNLFENKTIVVGVLLDKEKDSNVLRATVALAERLKARIHLVHVIDVLNSAVLVPHLPFDLGIQAMAMQVEAETMEWANREISILAKTLELSTYVTTKVLRGQTPSSGLQAEAANHNTAMIISGALPKSHRFVPSGFSCALDLMTTSKTPVLIIRNDARVNFSKDKLYFIIADNLRENTLDAISTAGALAQAMRLCTVAHLYVNRDQEDFQKKIESLVQKGLTKLTGINLDEFIQTDLEKRKHLLSMRAKKWADSVEHCDGSYLTAILTGKPGDTVLDFAHKTEADVIVFGRHRMVHTHPMSLGQIPVFEMLNCRSALLVVPSIS